MPNLRAESGWLLAIALALPMLMGFYLPPLATWLNQCLALLVWGGAVLGLSSTAWDTPAGCRPWSPAAVAAGVLAAIVLLNGLGFGVSLAQPVIGCFSLVAAALIAQLGFRLAQQGQFEPLMLPVAWGLLWLGLLTAVACVMQVFLPQYCGNLILPGSRYAGRAVGTIGQPNLAATAMAWSIVAAGLLLQRGRLHRVWAVAGLVLLVLGIVLTASRMGLVWLGLMLLVAVLESSWHREVRRLLAAALPLALICWWLANQLLNAQGADLALTQRTADWASSSSRTTLWRESLQMVIAQPLFGVGWADFSFAWTLTPFDGRGPRFHNHAHSLPLHLAVELGLPAALLFCALMLRSLMLAWRAVARAAPSIRAQGRLILLMLAMLALHSMLEYPLWYFFLLLPAAFMLGLCEGLDASPSSASEPHARSWPWLALGMTLLVAALFSATDYLKIARLYLPSLPGAAPDLPRRLQDARGSVFNGTIAMRATATEMKPGPSAVRAAEIAAHGLLDVPLLIAWADALAASGDADRARYLAQRIYEFDTPDVDRYRAACQVQPQPYQCQPPSRSYALTELRH